MTVSPSCPALQDASKESSKACKAHKATKEHRERPRKDSESRGASKEPEREQARSAKDAARKLGEARPPKEEKAPPPKAAFKEPKMALKETKLEGMSPKGGPPPPTPSQVFQQEAGHCRLTEAQRQKAEEEQLQGVEECPQHLAPHLVFLLLGQKAGQGQGQRQRGEGQGRERVQGDQKAPRSGGVQLGGRGLLQDRGEAAPSPPFSPHPPRPHPLLLPNLFLSSLLALSCSKVTRGLGCRALGSHWLRGGLGKPSCCAKPVSSSVGGRCSRLVRTLWGHGVPVEHDTGYLGSQFSFGQPPAWVGTQLTCE